MIRFIDSSLSNVTMYRLVLYYTLALLVAALGLGFFHLVPADPATLALSVAIIGLVAWPLNTLFCTLLRVPANRDSIYITAGLLALIMPPAPSNDWLALSGLALAAAVATISKFVVVFNHKHLFNPVALGAVASAYLLDQPATWWAGGNYVLLPIVLAGGLLVARKVQRFEMLAVYAAANIAAALAFSGPGFYGQALIETIAHSPLFFAGFAMLTEPLTAPVSRWPSAAYGAIVGVLSSPNVHLGEFYLTPEVAFLVGNAFAFLVGPRGRFKLKLQGVERLADDCYEFAFSSQRPHAFKAGQYLDWTLSSRLTDNRGNRRPFTIASAPGDRHLRIGVKFYTPASTFKTALLAMQAGDEIHASQVSGDFVLPRDTRTKLAFIAGGIGITPFVSMAHDMLARREVRDVILFYGNNRPSEIAYGNVFLAAEQELGWSTVHAIAKDAPPDPQVHEGFIDARLIKQVAPDFLDRTFYISGPRAMVTGFQDSLRKLGVKKSRIKVDFFPGFA
jgi:glycine betaine catabolism B